MIPTLILACLLACSIAVYSTCFWKVYDLRPDYDAYITVSNTVQMMQIISWATTIFLQLAWITLAIKYRASHSVLAGKNLQLGPGFRTILFIMYASIISGVVWCTSTVDEMYAIREIGISSSLWNDILLPGAALGILLTLTASAWQVMIITTIDSTLIKQE